MNPVKADLDLDTCEVVLTCDLRDLDRCRSVPGLRNRGKQGEWRAKASWPLCTALRAVFGERLEIGPDLAAWAWEQHVWMNRARELANLNPIDTEGAARLFGYQRIAVEWIKTVDHGLLALPMGAGKTLSVIQALQDLPDMFPALIVCPQTVKASWLRELKKWSPGLTAAQLTGTAPQRAKILNLWTYPKEGIEPPQILIAGWETIRLHTKLAPFGSTKLKDCVECNKGSTGKPTACEKCPKQLNAIPFRTIVGDEIHRISEPTNRWTRALWAIAHGSSVTHRIGLTGTPMRNSPLDLWSILHFLEPSEWPARSAWQNRYCSVGYNPFGPPRVTGLNPDTEDELRQTLDVRMLRWPHEAIMAALPPKSYEIRQVELPAAARKRYDELRDELLTELDDADATQVIAFNPLAQLARLSQMASASIEVVPRDLLTGKAFDEEDLSPSFRMVEPSPKLDALEEILEELDLSEQVVVFAVSRQLIGLAEARFNKSGERYVSIHGGVDDAGRLLALEAFAQGRARVLLCTVGAGAEGLNLQSARILIHLQRSFSAVSDAQVEARVHRTGQERPVTIIDVLAVDTTDERVREVLLEKNENMAALTRDRQRLAYFLEKPVKEKPPAKEKPAKAPKKPKKSATIKDEEETP